MKELPILFGTPMVQAIIAGRKTKTRRIVKGIALDWLQPDMFTPEYVCDPENNLCPYGYPGDIIWVRESFNYFTNAKCDGELSKSYIYKADNEKIFCNGRTKWKPSIHMPKEASRIWLKNIGSKIERLNDISNADAISEGIEPLDGGFKSYEVPEAGFYGHENSAIHSFTSLWESINGKSSWNNNPWIWVVEFEVLSINGKP